MKRHYLLLQGVCSPFFARLADQLTAKGHEVSKINFTGGDVAYWLPRGGTSYRLGIFELADFLSHFYKRYAVTDQIVFGDRRPIHRQALYQAKAQGVRNHVFEEGYFRPYWVTLERDGVNTRSHLPKNALWYLNQATRLETEAPNTQAVSAFQSPFWRRAWHDVNYHLAGALNPLFFRRYRTHAQESAPLEYFGYARRLPRLQWLQHAERQRLQALLSKKTPFYFLPLQLNGDMQVRDQVVLPSMTKLLEHVLQSFATHAPATSALVIKNHPLDLGLVNYSKHIKRLSREYEIEGRVHYFETGDLNVILDHALGTVTLNSTVGNVALERGCATIALAEAIYALEGLTFQHGLDRFWVEPQEPDRRLYQAFRTVVLHATQVNGGFYCPQGMRLAAAGSLSRLTADHSPLEVLLKQEALLKQHVPV